MCLALKNLANIKFLIRVYRTGLNIINPRLEFEIIHYFHYLISNAIFGNGKSIINSLVAFRSIPIFCLFVVIFGEDPAALISGESIMYHIVF